MNSTELLTNSLPDLVGQEDLGTEYVVLSSDIADFDDVAEAMTHDGEDWFTLFCANYLNYPDPIVMPEEPRDFYMPTAAGMSGLKELQEKLNEEGV